MNPVRKKKNYTIRKEKKKEEKPLGVNPVRIRVNHIGKMDFKKD